MTATQRVSGGKRKGRGHLSSGHPLAEVARRHCAAHRGTLGTAGIGGIACGACWERAIRDDERVAVELGLPREAGPDPSYVDEVAVEAACEGRRTRLTPVERAEAIRRLDAAGLTATSIAHLLGMSDRDVRATLAGLALAVPAVELGRVPAGQDGIWGATSEPHRRALRRQRAAGASVAVVAEGVA
jgi:hypothetical protein